MGSEMCIRDRFIPFRYFFDLTVLQNPLVAARKEVLDHTLYLFFREILAFWHLIRTPSSGHASAEGWKAFDWSFQVGVVILRNFCWGQHTFLEGHLKNSGSGTAVTVPKMQRKKRFGKRVPYAQVRPLLVLTDLLFRSRGSTQ